MVARGPVRRLDGKVANGPQTQKPPLWVSPVVGADGVLPTDAVAVGQPASVAAAVKEMQPNCDVIVSKHGILYYTVLYYTLPCRSILYYTAWYCRTLYYIMLYCTIVYGVVL